MFGLIVLGYVFARANVITAEAGRGIALFVFNISIPALLFRTVATMAEPEASPWLLWLVYFGGLAIVWVITSFVSRHVESLNYSGGASAAMATSFGNLAMLGTPLALQHFGNAVAVPVGLILAVHAATLWFTATLHRELSQHTADFSIVKTAKELTTQLFTNAIVLSLLAAALWRLTGLSLHPVPDKMLEMLAIAGVPTALVALGVSLSGYRLAGAWSGMATLIAIKMFVAPAIIFVLAYYVVGLPLLWIKLCVLLAAMPTGANSFLFAQKYNEAVPAVSSAIAVGTGLAAFTATFLLWLMDGYLI